MNGTGTGERESRRGDLRSHKNAKDQLERVRGMRSADKENHLERLRMRRAAERASERVGRGRDSRGLRRANVARDNHTSTQVPPSGRRSFHCSTMFSESTQKKKNTVSVLFSSLMVSSATRRDATLSSRIQQQKQWLGPRNRSRGGTDAATANPEVWYRVPDSRPDRTRQKSNPVRFNAERVENRWKYSDIQ